MKRQLGIKSSGNLDYHLKKLDKLITVRKDGLYELTDTGREALLSVETTETWTETEKHKLRMSGKMPKAAIFLGLLELSTTILILFYLLAVVHVFFSWGMWGYDTFLAVLVLAGFSSAVGIFRRSGWSWIAVMAKSAMIMLMSLSLLDHWLDPTSFPGQLSLAEVSYLLFVVAEIVVVFVALRRPLRDYLGVWSGIRLSLPVISGGLLCVFSGILLILLRSALASSENTPLTGLSGVTVFASMTDVAILCGLGIAIGGVLILLRTYTLGILVSVIFGLFPVPSIPGYPNYHAYHLFDIIYGMHTPAAFEVAVVVDVLPIVGAILALFSVRKVRG
jgi:hypothetical protein